MKTIIFIILSIISIAVLIKLLAWLTDIVIKVLMGAGAVVVLLVLLEVPIPPELTARAQEITGVISKGLANIDLTVLKQKAVALIELGREYLNG